MDLLKDVTENNVAAPVTASGCHAIFWPDGTWCWEQDLPQQTNRSDDYFKIAVPEWGDELDCDAIAEVIKANGLISDAQLCRIWGI